MRFYESNWPNRVRQKSAMEVCGSFPSPAQGRMSQSQTGPDGVGIGAREARGEVSSGATWVYAKVRCVSATWKLLPGRGMPRPFPLLLCA